MNIAAEIGFASLIQLALTAGGIVYFWADAKRRVTAVEDRLAKAETAANKQRDDFALYREAQARDLATREILREVETRIGGYIKDVEDRLTEQVGQVRERIDNLSDRITIQANGSSPGR